MLSKIVHCSALGGNRIDDDKRGGVELGVYECVCMCGLGGSR